MRSLRALVIGIDDYPVRPLGGCVADARAVARCLIDDLGVPPARVRLLLAPRGRTTDAERPTRAAIIAALEALAATDDGPVLIYFAGHGMWETRGRSSRESLVPVDYLEAGLIYDYALNLRLAEITDAAGQLSVILDCCKAAGVARREVRAHRIRALDADAVADALPALPPDFDRQPRGAGLGEPRSGLLVAAACQATEAAHEMPLEGGWRGAFTVAWLAAVRASDQRPETLSWAAIWTDLRSRLARLSNQTPSILGDPGRRLFSGTPGIEPGLAITREGDRYRIAGGTLTGVDPEARVAVFGPEVVQLPPAGSAAGAIGLVQVDSAGAFRSRGRAVGADGTPGAPFELPHGARGRVVQPGRLDALTVILRGVPGERASAIAAAGIRALDDGDPTADCTVDATDDGRFALSEALHDRADRDTGPWLVCTAAELVDALRHYAVFQRPLRMATRARSPGRLLEVRVLDCSDVRRLRAADHQDPDLPEVGPGRDRRFPVDVDHDQPVCVAVRNRGATVFYVTLLDCSCDGRVQILGASMRLEAGATETFWHGERHRAPFYPTLPPERLEARRTGVDRLVCIGSTEKGVDFGGYRLDAGLRDIVGDARMGANGGLHRRRRRRRPPSPVTVTVVPMAIRPPRW